jgi:hypothetical protein
MAGNRSSESWPAIFFQRGETVIEIPSTLFRAFRRSSSLFGSRKASQAVTKQALVSKMGGFSHSELFTLIIIMFLSFDLPDLSMISLPGLYIAPCIWIVGSVRWCILVSFCGAWLVVSDASQPTMYYHTNAHNFALICSVIWTFIDSLNTSDQKYPTREAMLRMLTNTQPQNFLPSSSPFLFAMRLF